jgi:3-oxoacyl-[acyl-carrier protein] reductase
VIEELKAVQSRPDQCFEALIVNVSDKKFVEDAVQSLLARWGQIDVLVNNAGITRDGLLMKMSEEDWDTVIDVNLKSVYNTCQTLVRPMLKAKKGKIINISSVVGLTGNAGQANYAASKSGMIGFTKALAQELASRNICVNCIAPGFITTRMTDALTEPQKKGILDKIPMGRLGTPNDIAQTAVFLASSLSDYITGQVITVDGGMVM